MQRELPNPAGGSSSRDSGRSEGKPRGIVMRTEADPIGYGPLTAIAALSGRRAGRPSWTVLLAGLVSIGAGVVTFFIAGLLHRRTHGDRPRVRHRRLGHRQGSVLISAPESS
jgi:hypothetical protein